jgi:hypothetical protein
LLIYNNESGWETENVEGAYKTLYELLQHMQHFVNLVDSPQLVGDEHQSNSERKFTTFLIEKHEFLGILFYRHSFSGLRLFRRVLLHSLIFMLLVGTNLMAYSVIDADCVKKTYCTEACVGAGCKADNATVPAFNVTNESKSRVTAYNSNQLFFFVEPSGADAAKPATVSAFKYCQDIRNPLWALSVVCVPLCTREVNRFFTKDLFQWPANVCAPAAPKDATRLVCERPDSAPRIGTAPPVLSTCSGLFDSPFSLFTLLKSAVIAIFLIACDQVITISLKLSQPIEWRTEERRILLRKPTAAAIAYVLCGVFLLIACAFIGLGVHFMGTLPRLWETFAIGFTISVLLKYLVFSPLRIWFWWLLLRVGIWRFLEGKAGERASNRTLKHVAVSKTMRRIEKLMIAGVEDKKYAEKAAKRKSTKMVEPAVEERSVRLQSSGSSRKKKKNVEENEKEKEEVDHEEEEEVEEVVDQKEDNAAKENVVEIEKVDDGPSSPRRGARAVKPRPTEPSRIRPIYMDTSAIENPKSFATISFQPSSAAELLEMAESAAEMYNNESNSVFTGPVCCTFLFLLVFLYVGTAAAAIVFDCPQQSLLAAESALIVAVVTFVFAAVSMALFIYVRVKRDSLARCTLPCTTLFFVVGVLALGLMLILTLVVNITTCPIE